MQSKKTEFTGKKITKYAGLSSFMPFILTKLNLFLDFEKIFPTSISNATKLSNTQILLTVILSSLCGVFRVRKISNFTYDILIQTLLNLKYSISYKTIRIMQNALLVKLGLSKLKAI